MQKIRLDRIPRRKESISSREFGADGILLDPRSGDYFEINEVAMLIWKHVDGKKTIDQIIRELSSHFDGDHEEMAKDTIEFLEELISREIISI